MKIAISVYLALSLFGTPALYAQSVYATATESYPDFTDFIVIRPRLMQPVSDTYGIKLASFGVNLGYGKVFDNRHWGADATVFGDLLGSEFDFASNKSLQTSTLTTGLSFNPYYVVNPESNYFQ